MDGNYDEVLARLRSERLIRKFVLKFLEDKSYELLCSSMEKKDYEEAFRAAHTIKGVCQNLGFTRLLQSSSRMADALRHGWTPEADATLGRLEQDYQITVNAVCKFRDCEAQ